jgi:hypothetical protein
MLAVTAARCLDTAHFCNTQSTISKLQYALTSCSLKHRLFAEPFEPKAAVGRLAQARFRETVHTYGEVQVGEPCQAQVI